MRLFGFTFDEKRRPATDTRIALAGDRIDGAEVEHLVLHDHFPAGHDHRRRERRLDNRRAPAAPRRNHDGGGLLTAFQNGIRLLCGAGEAEVGR